MDDDQAPTIGVALSGGGHRASLWAAGALLAITDAGANEQIVSVSSVSGGSIANGVVASRVDLTTVDGVGLEAALRPAVRMWAHDGLFFPGPTTDRYVAGVMARAGVAASTLLAAAIVLVATGRSWPMEATAIAGAAFLVAAAAAGLAVAARLPEPVRAGTVAGSVSGTLALLAGLEAARRADQGWWVLAVVVGTLAVVAFAARWAYAAFAERSEVVDDALAATLFASPTGPVTLAGLDRPVNHVFCATNLATADHLYLTPEVVYGNELGCGRTTPKLRLSTAVQASACLPGAFTPRRLPGPDLASGIGDDVVVLTDGGVYDNMADQWELGFANRRKRFGTLDPAPTSGQDDGADVLVVVNASRAFTRAPIPGAGALGELAALIRCKDVLYDVSTAVRRRYLVDGFKRTGAAGRRGGALVHIAQEPGTVVEAYAPRAGAATPRPDSPAARADVAKRFLERLDRLDPCPWEDVADRNSSVPTTLAAVGPGRAVDLLHHAYVLTRVNLFVLLGIGELPGVHVVNDHVTDRWARARFERLVETIPEEGAS